jgi:hypothetical protein
MKDNKTVDINDIKQIIDEFKKDINENNRYIKDCIKSHDYHEAAHYDRYNNVMNITIKKLQSLIENK